MLCGTSCGIAHIILSFSQWIVSGFWSVHSCLQVAEQAVTLLYCVTTELAKRQPGAEAGTDQLERKLWHSICEVHYIAGCLNLNDVSKAEGEQLRGCAQQLDQILMTQDYHQGRGVVSHSIEAKTLDLYGKCAMGLGELDKAESLFIRLQRLSKVLSACFNVYHMSWLDKVSPSFRTSAEDFAGLTLMYT